MKERNQSSMKSTNQPPNESINERRNQCMNKRMTEAADVWINDTTKEWTNKWIHKLLLCWTASSAKSALRPLSYLFCSSCNPIFPFTQLTRRSQSLMAGTGNPWGTTPARLQTPQVSASDPTCPLLLRHVATSVVHFFGRAHHGHSSVTRKFAN